ncbi:hypothetical protein P154DRAFT_194117 [Amniculicola lignicola CBS 123094]|uniref:Uncharacterized protein n=1 Tax=Amniculicola lignicola CBS 123094 TaxID=1392246 RepID=A0A6A5WNW3_9PLEO|nr:hypothetical protein P154DRAFT_194117 [Amniculicola lignicola CBS 123094]
MELSAGLQIFLEYMEKNLSIPRGKQPHHISSSQVHKRTSYEPIQITISSTYSTPLHILPHPIRTKSRYLPLTCHPKCPRNTSLPNMLLIQYRNKHPRLHTPISTLRLFQSRYKDYDARKKLPAWV